MAFSKAYVNELSNDFVKTVHELGIPLTNDFNGSEQKGVGLYQFMNNKGKIGLIIKDKKVIDNHRFNHENYPDKKRI